jgi:hypothetical protein
MLNKMVKTKRHFKNHNRRKKNITKKGGAGGNNISNNLYNQEYYSKDEVKLILNIVKNYIVTLRESIKDARRKFDNDINELIKPVSISLQPPIIMPDPGVYATPANALEENPPHPPERKSSKVQIGPSGYLLSQGTPPIRKNSGKYGFSPENLGDPAYESLASLYSYGSRGSEQPYALVDFKNENNNTPGAIPAISPSSSASTKRRGWINFLRLGKKPNNKKETAKSSGNKKKPHVMALPGMNKTLHSSNATLSGRAGTVRTATKTAWPGGNGN